MTILPWSSLLLTASHMGIIPSQFWALSVREWRALVGEGYGLDGARLSELSNAFPDDHE